MIAPLILAAIHPRARRLAMWTDYVWQSGQASPDQGQAIGAAEVARILSPAATAGVEAEFHATHTGALSAEAAEAQAALDAQPAWRDLCERLRLERDEAELLMLLLAVELDPALARVVGYLHDDGRMTEPTPWLAARLFGRVPVPFAGRNLRRWLLAAPSEGVERLTTGWHADPALVQALAHGEWRDPALETALIAGGPVPELCLHPAVEGDPADVELVGAPGIGRRTLAAQYAASRGQELLALDLARVAEPGALLVRALRQAALTGALAYFGNADAVGAADWARLRALGVGFLRGVRHPSGHAEPIMLAPLPIAARVMLWRQLSDAPPPAALVTQRLSPAEIVAAVADPSALRPRRQRPDHTLLSALPTPYLWDDLVLPADVTAQLRAFESQVRLRWVVYEDWGFSRLTHLGQGISALFGGPSGTGKTMAAQVVARSLGLELLRVDLAGVVNKYVGETEKKLREIFDACEDSGAVLFFDEADALFGNRTQVKDAHDRFANIEIDYLLQRIERFDGVAILATNRRQDLDPAFVRRLRFVVEFLPPRAEERLTLWQRALPEFSPAGERIRGDVDWGYLADRLVMTGAEIKTVTLGAAFLAREEGSRIGMRHLLTAASREMAKHGQKLRAPLREAGE